jgi:light-regulated signal transduction histidine kinase (bacteriophytochrome)
MVEVRTRQIESSNRELQTFAYAASHDLQEPLRKILSFGDRLKVIASTSMNDQSRDYLARIINAATRMKDLINGLLQFSRIGATPQRFEPVDLARITKEVLSDMEVRIQEMNAVIEVKTLPVVDANPIQIRQLIQNLVSNGLKYQPPGNKPTIVISANIRPSGKLDAPGDVCELSFKDNGIGIEEKYFSKLFQVFQRLHTRNEYEGTGVGLAICKKIIDCHKGSCVIKSELGKGADFIVTLPVRQVEEQPLTKPAF